MGNNSSYVEESSTPSLDTQTSPSAASENPTTPAPAPTTPVVTVSSDPTLGSYLVAPNGMTLYTFKSDTAGTSTCYGGCSTLWPAYSPATPLTGGNGVVGDLSTTTRTNGTEQLTYKGMPVYFYSKDKKPGDTYGQNFGKLWFVVKP
ncbi:hypothetical protein HY311_02880 [Candidatus Nomurabacteria bacterium]|nr:hypothetical protein [Candidatus Nomurabacteria bacterium]